MSRKDNNSKTCQIIRYYQNCYKIIGIDLSKQTIINIPQQIHFLEKLEEDNGATNVFFVAEKQQKTVLNFYLDSLNVTE